MFCLNSDCLTQFNPLHRLNRLYCNMSNSWTKLRNHALATSAFMLVPPIITHTAPPSHSAALGASVVDRQLLLTVASGAHTGLIVVHAQSCWKCARPGEFWRLNLRLFEAVARFTCWFSETNVFRSVFCCPGDSRKLSLWYTFDIC